MEILSQISGGKVFIICVAFVAAVLVIGETTIKIFKYKYTKKDEQQKKN